MRAAIYFLIGFGLVLLILTGCEPMPEHPCVEYAEYSCEEFKDRYYGAQWNTPEREQFKAEYMECKAASLLKCMREGKEA